MPDRSSTRGLVATCLGASLMPLNSTMIAVAIPSIANGFGADPDDVTQALVTTYLIAAIALQSAGGTLSDRIGRWQIFGVGQVLIAVGAVLGWLAPNIPLLACSRVIMAGGGALVVPAALAVLRCDLPPRRRARAFGAFGVAMGLAAGVGPIIGGELVAAFGWRSVFAVNLPVLAVSAMLVGTAYRRRAATAAATRFDWCGASLLTAALVVLVAGLEAGGPLMLLLLAAGAPLLAAFVWWERRITDPVVVFALFRTRQFSAGSAVIALLNLVSYALLFEIPLLTARLFHLEAAATGRLLIFMMLAMAATSLVAGRLVDTYGSRLVALAGVLVSVAGIVLMLVHVPQHAGELRLPLALLGAGLGLANPAAQNAALRSIVRERSGMAAGVNSSTRYLGGVAGVAALAHTLDLGGPPASVLATHQLMLAIFLGVLLCGLGCAALLSPARAADRTMQPE